jgi:general secretion pathway protein G
MTSEHDSRGRRAGFTLIEVLLVVAILGILAGVVVANFAGRQERAMIQATRASLKAMATAVEMYEVDTGQYPSSLQNLVSSDGSPNWNGPYLKTQVQGQVPPDAWGQPFEYTRSENSFRVTSPGPPGKGKPITSEQF